MPCRPTASPEDLKVFDDWTRDLFLEDAAWAAGFVRSADPPGPLYLAGFGFGAAMAYGVAARADQPVGGLIILDGVPDGPGLFRSEGGRGPVLDVAGTRQTFDERQRLLQAVVRDPKGPSPVSGGKAGTALADLAYNAPSFGGVGGMSTARDGVTDPRALAQLLLTFDRYWPRDALDGRAKPPKQTMPVLAFASGAQGQAWIDRVRQGAESFARRQDHLRRGAAAWPFRSPGGQAGGERGLRTDPRLAGREVRSRRRTPAVSVRRRCPR